MKKLRTKSLLTSLVIAAMISSCKHDEPINPAGTVGQINNDSNAKTNTTFRLIKYGPNNVQYIKSGPFLGLVLKSSNATYYRMYSYNNNNGTTNLFVTRETFSQATNIKSSETVYEIANGHCISSKGSNGMNYEYKYTPAGLLDEVKMFYQNITTTFTYSYLYNAATNSYRLDKVNAVNNFGPIQETKFTYTAIPDKYHFTLEDDNVDALLPFFGKFSDVLVKDMEINSTSGLTWSTFREFSYVMDNNGYPLFRTLVYHPNGKGNNQQLSTSIMEFKYSQYWQGI